MGFSKKLKSIFFPSRTVLRIMEKRLETLQNSTDRILAETRKQQIRGTHTFRNHLAKIGDASPLADTELSYSFRFTSSDLRPEIMNHDPAKIVVATVVLGEAYRAKVAPCLESHRRYCEANGYAYADLRLSPNRLLRHPSWYKITLIHHLIQLGYQQVAFIDGDALITNGHIRLETFLDRLSTSGKDLLLANDESGLNAGILFANNSPSLLRLLDLIWMFNFEEGHENWEQHALRSLIDDFSFLGERLLVTANAKDFNSYPRERDIIHKLNSPKNMWSKGDFICHFSGMRSPLVEQLIAAYLKESSS